MVMVATTCLNLKVNPLAELSGTRYPDVDLSAFSDYERMTRLSECLVTLGWRMR